MPPKPPGSCHSLKQTHAPQQHPLPVPPPLPPPPTNQTQSSCHFVKQCLQLNREKLIELLWIYFFFAFSQLSIFPPSPTHSFAFTPPGHCCIHMCSHWLSYLHFKLKFSMLFVWFAQMFAQRFFDSHFVCNYCKCNKAEVSLSQLGTRWSPLPTPPLSPLTLLLTLWWARDEALELH